MALVLKKPVIAITGSSGKTTTKEMIASILGRRWKVFKSERNWNDAKSMRRYVTLIKPYHRALVLEYGISGINEIRRSCKVIKPNIGIVTMIGSAHIGKAGSTVEGLARAKSQLILNMKQDGKLFINADDSNSQLLDTSQFQGTIITVGIEKEADYRATDIVYAKKGMKFKVLLDSEPVEFYIPIYGRHNVYNALFAIALSHNLGFSPETIKKGLSRYNKPERRLKVYKTKNNVTIIDDTWNSNPDAAKAAIDVLSTVGEQNRVAVLSRMGELGHYSANGHKEVGEYISPDKVDYVLTYGKKAKPLAEAAIASGLTSERVIHTTNRKVLHKNLKEITKPGTTILVKGSHDMHMDITVGFLRKNSFR